MYKTLSPETLKEMEERGHIMVSFKEGWETCSPWSSKPAYLYYCLGSERERIFTCYISTADATTQITNLEATKVISGEKALVDAYMYVALKGLIRFARNNQSRRLVIDSYISATADYMLDMGFRITAIGSAPSVGGARGCKTLKD